MDVKSLLTTIRKPGVTIAELHRELEALPAAIAVAEEAADALEAQRRAILLSDDDAALVKVEDQIVAANRTTERLYGARDLIRKRIEEIEAAEAEGNRHAVYDEAKQKADAAARRLKTEYAKHAKALAALIVEIAEADVLVDKANKALPDGAEQLRHAEAMVRDLPSMPDEIVSEEEVELWAFESSGDPYPEDRQHEIEPSAITGYGRKPCAHNSAHFVKRRFVKRTVLPREYAKPGPRLAQIVLPGLKACDPHFWRGDDRTMPPWLVLDRAREIEAAQQAGPRWRKAAVEYVLSDDLSDDEDEGAAAEPETAAA